MVRSARSIRWTTIKAGEQSGPVSPPELQAQLAAIEAALERGDYKPGPWQKLTDELRNRDQAERAALTDDLTRVSRKLHLRRHRYTMSVLSGVLLEALAGILGGILIAAGVVSTSNSLAIVGMLLWVACFEPLLKLGVGTALSVQYDYAYLYGGVEPRFKPSFGSYLALTPLKRVVLQISGMVGSPLGALVASQIAGTSLPAARVVSWVVFWIVVLMNVGGIAAELAYVRRIGPIRIPEGSATMAIVELRGRRRPNGSS